MIVLKSFRPERFSVIASKTGELLSRATLGALGQASRQPVSAEPTLSAGAWPTKSDRAASPKGSLALAVDW